MMFWTKRVVIGDAERGLVYRNRRFERVLAPGVYRLFAWRAQLEVVVHDIRAPEYAGKDADALIAALGERVHEIFVLADIGTGEVGLLSKYGKLEDVLAPGARKLYWRGLVPVEVERVAMSEDLRVEAGVARRLRQLGMLPVFAIGNEGIGTSRSPGNYPETLSVGAIDQNRRVAPFSGSVRFNRDRDPIQPDVVAPGVGIISAKPGGGYYSMDGTSTAAPHVAGVAALLWQAKPDATADQIELAIRQTCLKLEGEDPQRYGNGLVDPLAALAALTGEVKS